MPLRVLGLSSSPRAKGNSDLLLLEALAGAKAAGAETDYLSLRRLRIAPCAECNACHKTGRCSFEDDYQGVMAKMLEADRLIFATPVFFMAVCAQGKLLIDRCQCLWSRKYILKQPLFPEPRDRRAMVIAVAGSKTKRAFECIRLTMRYYFDALEMNYALNLFVNKVDAKGDVLKHPSALKEAFRLGQELVHAQGVPPEKPLDVELF